MTTHTVHFWSRRPSGSEDDGRKGRAPAINNSNRTETDVPESRYKKTGAAISARLRSRRVVAGTALTALVGAGTYVAWPHLSASAESAGLTSTAGSDGVRYALPAFTTCMSLMPTQDIAELAPINPGDGTCLPAAQLPSAVQAVGHWVLDNGGGFTLAFTQRSGEAKNSSGAIDGGWVNIGQLQKERGAASFTLTTMAGRLSGVVLSGPNPGSAETFAQVGDEQFSWSVTDPAGWQPQNLPPNIFLAQELAGELGPVPGHQTQGGLQ